MMKRRNLLFCLYLAVSATTGGAQDLDTTWVVDQFDTGVSRGNATGSLTSGAPATDGSEFLDYSGTDTSGTLRYINGYAGASATDEIESPVVDCTVAQNNPDRGLIGTIPAIPPNNRPGASDGSRCVLIGDDGGYNGIFFGESDDRDYFVQIDVYCFDRSDLPTTTYESVQLAARAARDNDPDMTNYSFNLDRAGSYAIVYDPMLRTVEARRWNTGNSWSDIHGRVPSAFQKYAEKINVIEGWHTFRIECQGSNIRYFFDGASLASVIDDSQTHGRPGFGYREDGILSAEERQGHFDNLKAGPINPSVLLFSGCSFICRGETQ